MFKVPKRMLTAEADSLQTRRESQKLAGWTFGGAFIGFMVLGFLGMCSLALWDHIFGLTTGMVWMIVFFSFPIAGLVLGGRAGHRIGKRRVARTQKRTNTPGV
jgi:hypothetical protein